MDPAFDRKPSKEYKCHFCNKVGDHYGQFCPRHPDPNSIGYRRRGHTKGRGRTAPGRPTEYRDGPRRDYSPHFYDDRRSRFDDPSHGRGRSRSPLHEARDRDRLDRYVPERNFSRLSLSREARSKRKATRSPSPHKTAPRKKNTTRIKKDMWAKKDPKNWSAWKPTFLDDLMSGRKDQEEGRLSYDDEVDGDAPLSSPVTRTVRSPSVEVMEIDRPEACVFKVDKRSAQAIRDQSLKLAVLDMIRVESVKTDLLLFINNVEHLPPLNPFLAQLFKSQQSIWVNKTLKKTRPCPTDFFEFLVKDEQIESTDCEMVDAIRVINDDGQMSVCAEEEAVDSDMVLVEPAPTVIGKNEDNEMLDVVLAAVSAMEANSVGAATGSVPVEKLNEADKGETGAETIETFPSDEYRSEGVRQETAPAMVARGA